MKHRELRQLNIVFALFAATFVCSKAWSEPTLERIESGDPAHPGQPHDIVLEMTWPEAPEAYTILPAEFSEPEWGTMELVRTEGFSRDGQNVVRQIIQVTADEPGEYTVPEIRVSFMNPEAMTPAETTAEATTPPDRSAYPTLRIASFPLSVQPSGRMTWISAGLGVLLLLAIVCVVVLARRNKAAPESMPEPGVSLDDIQTTLHVARKHRLDGNYYGFYADLGRAAELIADRGGDGNLAGVLNAQAQHVGYGGHRPTEDEMDGHFRDVERALTGVSGGERS